FSSRRRHTRSDRDWSSDVCSSDLFAVLTSINTCGYDEELNISSPLREQIRQEVAHNLSESEDAKQAADLMCEFYRDHADNDPSRSEERRVGKECRARGGA